jgi:hypothetical protein
MVGLRASQGTVSRNFHYPCCFRAGCVALGSDPEGAWGKFRGLGRDQPGRRNRVGAVRAAPPLAASMNT